MQSSAVQQAYSGKSDLYIELFAADDLGHPDDLDLMRRHLTDHSGRVVDLGCGPGHLTGFLAGHGAQVLGLDLVPEFVQHARRTHPDLTFHQGSFTNIPLADASVSAALCWYSLIHLRPDTIDEALTEVRRVVRRGGSVVVGFFVGDVVEAFDHQVTTAYRWPMDEMARRLKTSGFDEVERLQRSQQGTGRPHGAIVATAA